MFILSLVFIFFTKITIIKTGVLFHEFLFYTLNMYRKQLLRGKKVGGVSKTDPVAMASLFADASERITVGQTKLLFKTLQA